MDKHAPEALANFIKFEKTLDQFAKDMEYAFTAGSF